MGFLTNLLSSAVKTVVTPAAMLKDVVDAATGEEPTNTIKLLESAFEDLEEAGEDLVDGDIL
jgi:hypothetical protein